VYNSETLNKILEISKPFLGKPYLQDALDKEIIRTDAFDCMTFISTVLALALSKDLDEACEKIITIDYLKKPIAIENRCHFMSLDWNPHNAQQGYIQDITQHVVNRENQIIAKKANAVIDKAKWFKRKNIIVDVKPQKASIDYLPIEDLFTQDGLNLFIFDQLPEISILEIVRPNWNLEEKIGTHLNVSHLGFAFKKGNQWVFRHASRDQKKVVDVDLEDCLKQYLRHETVKGINIQQILVGY